jgi:hypothetical protein
MLDDTRNLKAYEFELLRRLPNVECERLVVRVASVHAVRL